MVAQAVNVCYVALAQCINWFETIISAINGKFYIVAGFTIVLIASLIIYPIRGSGFSSVSLSEFTKGAVSFGNKQYDPKHLKGHTPSGSYRGKFEHSAKRTRYVNNKKR